MVEAIDAATGHDQHGTAAQSGSGSGSNAGSNAAAGDDTDGEIDADHWNIIFSDISVCIRYQSI